MKIHTPYYKLFMLFVVAALVYGCQGHSQTGKNLTLQDDWLYADLEFEMPKVEEPAFSNNSVSITDFGAANDGLTKSTQAFADAIDAVSEKGGGRVVVPRGIWLTGPIVLKSNINLHVEEGALILFSRDFDDYPLISTSFEGLETYRCISPIFGRDLENVAITGSGVIDGNGDAWRPVKKSKMTDGQWKGLVASGGVLNEKGDIWYPSEKALKGATMSDMNVPEELKTKEDHEAIKDFLRPVMVSLVKCNKVLLDGPTFQNSPAWNLHPLMCENVTLRNLTVRNPWYSQNGDGLDLESCKNSVVYNCTFDVGDDAICIKSGKNEDGRKRGIPTENLIVRNNVVYHGHGGFVVGSEMSGGVKNVHVSNITFIGTDIGLRFKSTRGRGGVVENIYISNIDMINIPAEAIGFNLFYGGLSPIPEAEDEPIDVEKLAAQVPPVTEETPQFRNITMKNILCRGAGRAIALQGLPEMNIENMYFENINISADRGVECVDAKGIQFVNMNIQTEKGPVMQFYNAKDVLVKNFDYQSDEKQIIKIDGPLSRNIQFAELAIGADSEGIVLGKSVKKEEVKF